MKKLIRNVSELPEWFDIHPYENWRDKDPEEATWAVRDKILTQQILYSDFVEVPGKLADETKKLVIKRLAETASDPYRCANLEVLYPIYPDEDPIHSGEKNDQFRWSHHDEEEIQKLTSVEAKRILSGAPVGVQEEIRGVTLWDVMIWMERNKEILDEIEETVQRLAKEKGWKIDQVRSCLQDEIPIWGLDGEGIIKLSGHPTIPAFLKKIEKQLLKRGSRSRRGYAARYADVRKLFDYRVAAYLDLMSWSHLKGFTITKKCLANALFPHGQYGEVDMMPSKTVGKFIKRVVEEGYIYDLTAKSAEMENMQS